MLAFNIIGCEKTNKNAGEIYDFGIVFPEEKKKVVHTFHVKNNSSRKVNILGLQKSCICTAAKFDKKVLVPGESADLRMEIETRNIPNVWQVSSSIVTDDPDRKEWDYTVRFKTYVPVVFSQELVMLSRAESLNHKTVLLEVYRDRSGKEDVLKTLKCPGSIIAKILLPPRSRSLEGGTVHKTEYLIDLHLADIPVKVSGQKSEVIQAITESGRTASMAVTWREESLIAFNPSTLSFGNIAKDGKPSRIVVVSSSSAVNFALTKTGGEDHALDIEGLDGLKRPRHTLKFVLRPGQFGKKFLTGTVKLSTSMAEQAEIEIPWSAFNIRP